MATVPPFGELIATTQASAVHLEMRDAYTPDDQRFVDWLAGKPLPVPANPAWAQLGRAPRGGGRGFPSRPRRLRAARGLHPLRVRDHRRGERLGRGGRALAPPAA